MSPACSPLAYSLRFVRNKLHQQRYINNFGNVLLNFIRSLLMERIVDDRRVTRFPGGLRAFHLANGDAFAWVNKRN